MPIFLPSRHCFLSSAALEYSWKEFKAMDETTRDFYRRNAQFYFNTTKDSFVPVTMDRFLSIVPMGGSILDLGCGSGRDSKRFLTLGYDVTSVDGSPELAALASSYIGKPVVLADYADFHPGTTFDGIWAHASLVHLRKEEMLSMLERVSFWLKEGGALALSVRYGDFEGFRDGRYYTYWTEESLSCALEGTKLKKVAVYLTEDVRPGVENTWLNMILKKPNN